uniref:Tyr recombinase domain-containing protein n=1 Tax=Marinobacter nauticus TaxID=2743 RepID=A0A455W2B0_MARNT|nr:hypothetical protein YBY_08680 [Marinobacter nauticus]
MWILDPQQLTHILRHTFASHYMMNGGDILTLQRILGHSDITMTMRYAHLITFSLPCVCLWLAVWACIVDWF